MAKHPNPTQKEFDSLMTWLASNGEDPGSKYEHIRQSLVKVFTWNGCSGPEDLADVAIDRVTRKAPEIMINYSGDPALYFYGVAKRMLRECRRHDALTGALEPLESDLLPGNNHQTNDSDEVDQKF